jgi:molybdate transport system substrate-binding protein
MKRALAFASLLLACMASAQAATLTVAVAASVQYAFAELGSAFERETGHRLKPVYNSSGKLAAQITHGAPFDVFLSADMDYPEQLYREGLGAAAPTPYAYGTLVLWTLNGFDLSDWQRLLRSDKVRRIALANPRLAPYGREALMALAHFGLGDILRPKLIYGESVSQVNQYTHSRAADAGFTAKSVVLAPQMRGQGTWIDVPAAAYQPIAQGIIVLKHGLQTHSAAAHAFRDFVLSPRARVIFARYGYLLP